MRDAYNKFKAHKEADPENDPLAAKGVEFKVKYSLEGFTPGLSYGDAVPDAIGDIASPYYPGAEYPIAKLQPIVSAAPEATSVYAQLWGGAGQPVFTLEPPSSVVVITHQSSYLTDNDMVLLGDGSRVFTDPDAFLPQQQQLELIANAIAAPVSAEMIVPGETATQDAIALQMQMSRAEVSSLTGVSAEMMHGAEAFGLHINGEAVDEIPSLEDLWPSSKSDDEEAEAPEATGETAPENTGVEVTDNPDYAFPDPFDGLDPGYSDSSLVDPIEGHSVVTGANVIVNEVLISSSWLDAPVISVMGDVVSLSVISQVNVLVDHDVGNLGEFVSSTAMNAASQTVTATTLVPDDAAADADQVEEADLGLPSNWAVTRIDGDLIQVNQVCQYNFVTDNDCAEIVFGSTNTYIGLGDNTVINLTNLAELGYGYDLIMIGGSMVSVNWISQINVMIDNDTMTFTGATPEGMSGSDNLLFNGATINTTGVDSYGEMQENFAAAGESFANGAVTIDASVAHDSVFEGTEILRVLYIEGDLTTINWIEQTNVLGDNDQVHLALDNFEEATGTSATVVAGSNSTINIATINEYGTDSEVAVQGEVYDDALLYQAELIDTDADPLGVNMPALATEAVAFLADDMLTPDIGPADAAIIATATESTTTPDVMQSMLA